MPEERVRPRLSVKKGQPQDVTSALVAYLSRHSSAGEQARAILLQDLLTFIEVRGRHESLDERGRATLQEASSEPTGTSPAPPSAAHFDSYEARIGRVNP